MSEDDTAVLTEEGQTLSLRPNYIPSVLSAVPSRGDGERAAGQRAAGSGDAPCPWLFLAHWGPAHPSVSVV